MSFRALAVSALLILHSIAGIATPVSARTDDELVKVPGGFLPKSNVHIVPEGSKIVHTSDSVQLFDADGKLLHSAPITGANPVFNNLKTSGNASLEARQTGTPSGTVLGTVSAPNINAFLGRWTVPPLPQVNSGQTLQYLIGIGTSDLSSLVFTVLQYGVAGNGGGPNWSVASWLLSGNQAFATNATATLGGVFPNNDISTQVSNEDSILFPPAGEDIWLGTFFGFQQASLQVTSTVPLTQVVVGLETTNAFSNGNLPNEPTNFFQLAILNKDGSAPSTIPWQLTPAVDFDFITIEVISNSGNDGDIAILRARFRVMMLLKALIVSTFLALRYLFAVASPTAVRSDDGLVQVPGGFLPRSNVHIVPQGGKVVHTSDSIQLLDVDGKVLHSAPRTRSTSLFKHLNIAETTSTKSRRSLQSASVTALFQAPSVFGYSGNWIVPPLPQVNGGQVLQYFIGLAPPSVDTLLFPVLQYGATANGGGAFWSLSTWLISGDQAFATNITNAAQRTAPGNTVDAFIVNEDQFLASPGEHVWFAGFSSFQGTSLQIQTAEVFNVVIASLEVSGATSLAELPNQTTNLASIAVQETSSGTFPSSIPWQLQSDPLDGITISVASSSGVTGGLQIKY
ncbi:hypothetical protein CVT26_013445 [Gymnopilus dilepis]|uniref:Uncharacterized protein n=1 Tax=Gymnopilus dilepis TaxID=231916 RepID=A0A409YWQ8_9AGAR|nr:hypothetical protein CVT26_013445 [Gymnopilus dilepis]